MLQKLWYDRTLRTQLLIAIGLINLGAVVLAGVTAVINARNDTRVEIEASLDLAKRFVRVSIQSLVASAQSTAPEGQTVDLSKHIDQLASRLRVARLRHVRILIADAAGNLVQLSPPPGASKTDGASWAPSWFTSLVEPHVMPQQLSVALADPAVGGVVIVEQPVPTGSKVWTLGSVVIAGAPADEIAEAWQDVASVFFIWLLLDLLVLGVLYLVLSRMLDPLANVARGLVKLEDGDYATRLTPPRIMELAAITERFNKLAETLGRAREENADLYGQLITVQEDERREIANELHDEASPCLFGIMANAMSVQRLVEARRDRKSVEVKSHVGEILKVTERLKQMNRAMLKKLRPVALGRVALPALVEDLLGELQRRYPDVALSHAVNTRTSTHGEDVDLTIYRCIQEGVTNAIRHGKADAVRVELFEKAPARNGNSSGTQRANGGNGHGQANDHDHANGAQHEGGAGTSSPTLQLIIKDDGRGILPDTALGFGLTVMRERVNALGGSCAIQSAPSQGALLRVVIPIAAKTARRPRRPERIEVH